MREGTATRHQRIFLEVLVLEGVPEVRPSSVHDDVAMPYICHGELLARKHHAMSDVATAALLPF